MRRAVARAVPILRYAAGLMRRLAWDHYVPLALLTLLVLLVSLVFAYGLLMHRNNPQFWDL